jgi:hypothetical protein
MFQDDTDGSDFTQTSVARLLQPEGRPLPESCMSIRFYLPTALLLLILVSLTHPAFASLWQ